LIEAETEYEEEDAFKKSWIWLVEAEAEYVEEDAFKEKKLHKKRNGKVKGKKIYRKKC
jgi:hypothetical protein